jgi:hypothetical protein
LNKFVHKTAIKYPALAATMEGSQKMDETGFTKGKAKILVRYLQEKGPSSLMEFEYDARWRHH